MQRGILTVFVFLGIILSVFSFSTHLIYAQEATDTDIVNGDSSDNLYTDDSGGAEVIEDNSASGIDEEVLDEQYAERDVEIEEGFEDNINELDEIDEEFQDAELEASAGITPDSSFYFVEDAILSRFRDDSRNREKKVAEIREMINNGDIESARKSLGRYRGYADGLEKEIDPEKREEARRSAAAIRNTLREIESEIPEEDREDFLDDIVRREGRITIAAEIASKIKELCVQLSELDPLQYSKVCSVDDDGDAPNWQKRLHKDLTKEQREEAKKFGKIMSQCFKTSGQDCACEEIPYTDFAQMCSTAALLAVACDVEGDEAACEKMDSLEMPELPDHLQSVFDDLGGGMMEDRFDIHVPRECQEAGVTNPRECGKIMIQTNAPEECRDELLRANVQNEREAREICEKIMFELNAPEECIEAGLTDHKECGVYMFEQNAPQECLDAGLTGERQSDNKKCREIMDSFSERGERGPPGHAQGFGFGVNCKAIQDSKERLDCYDGATQGARDFESRFREDQEVMKQCSDRCSREGAAWDFSGGECRCFNHQERGGEDFREEFREEFRDESGEFKEEFREEFKEGEFDNSGEGSFSDDGSGGDSGESTDSSLESGSGSDGGDSGITGESIKEFDGSFRNRDKSKTSLSFCEYVFDKYFCEKYVYPKR